MRRIWAVMFHEKRGLNETAFSLGPKRLLLGGCYWRKKVKIFFVTLK